MITDLSQAETIRSQKKLIEKNNERISELEVKLDTCSVLAVAAFFVALVIGITIGAWMAQ